MLFLDKQVSIAMMAKDNNGKDLKALNDECEKILCESFGGVTVSDGHGSWTKDGKLYKDKNFIFAMNYSGKLNKSEVDSLCKVINKEFKDGGQLAVSVWVNNSLMIIDKKDLIKDVRKYLAA